MYRNCNEIDFEALKARTLLIHYFGLGFIQLKLSKKYRLHFYTKEFPSILDGEEIHNHRYDFFSTILYGELDQEVFSPISGDRYLLEDESCREGVASSTEPKICGIEKIMEQHFTSGSRYFIKNDIFHRVKSAEAITLLERGEVVQEFAQVVRRVGSEKVCAFSKKVPETELWNIVGEMLQKAKG